GQATWESSLVPSAWHGVTTAVMGNCGVGFAPARPEDHDRLIWLMEGVEELPLETLHAGLDWSWRTFPEFLDALERRPHDVNIATQVPHAALRVYAMGERAINRELPTSDDLAMMTDLVEEAVRAGALGFSTSRTVNHRSATGEATPSLGAPREELVAIAAGLGRAGAGVMQVISDFDDLDEEFSIFRDMVRTAGRPLSLSVLAKRSRPQQWRQILDEISRANRDGLPMLGQVSVRAIGVLLGLELSLHPLQINPVFAEIEHLPLAQRAAAMRDPAFRERLVAAAVQQRGHKVLDNRAECDLAEVYELGEPPNYEPDPSDSILARAQRQGRLPEDLLVERMTENGGRAILYMPGLNYVSGNLDDVREMLTHPHTVPGLSDGGAHVGHICDASFPTSLLTYWCRDRERDRLDLPFIVQAQAARTAAAVGLHDRGVLAPGYRADLNIVDLDAMVLHHPEVHYDLPAGARRILQRAEGYQHTIVNGEETFRGGEPTGAYPGEMIRGARPAPAGGGDGK
ncbi:MAG TPA: amidohydrolase family protein, partial [Micromonosporaceae bacterium]